MLVVFVAVLVFLSSFAGWYVYLRPWTYAEILDETHLAVGESWELVGSVSEVRNVSTSYGDWTVVNLGGDLSCGFDTRPPEGDHVPGGPFTMNVRWEEYSFNGHPAVWSPSLLCPFPLLFASMNIVMDAVSYVMGLGLVLTGGNESGWSTYEFLTLHGERYPLSQLPVTLYELTPFEPDDPWPITGAPQWIVTAAAEYVRITGFAGHSPREQGAIVIDSMDSLEEVSANGVLRFDDVDGDGDASDGDRLYVRLDIPPGPNGWQTYILRIGGPYAGGLKYVLQGPEGPLEIRLGTEGTTCQLLHVSEALGPEQVSVLEIGRTFGTRLRYADLSLSLSDGEGFLTGGLGVLPLQLNATIRVDVQDQDGWLHPGDRILVSGLRNQTSYTFELRLAEERVSEISWFAGYGMITGRLPTVVLEPLGGSPYAIAADVSHWHQEFSFGKTLAVSLWEDGRLLLDAVLLQTGTLGTFPGGALDFLDLDGDGMLSTGDEFRLTGGGTAYRLEVSWLFGHQSAEVEVAL